MRITLNALIEKGCLIVTSPTADPKLAAAKIALGTLRERNYGEAIQIEACIDGKPQAVDLKISSIVEQLGITAKEVEERHLAGTLFICSDDQIGEEITLAQDVEDFLANDRGLLLEEVIKGGQIAHLSKGLGDAPASMNVTTERFMFVNTKSYDQGPRGGSKHCKQAVMINPDGERLTVARLVINPSRLGLAWEDLFAEVVNEAKVLTELQKGKHQERLYGLIIGENKRGERILTLYLEYFPDGDLLRARDTISDEKKIVIASGAIASLCESHALGISNNDIKLENIFVNISAGRAVIGDNGLSRNGDRTTALGSWNLFSPEKMTANYQPGMEWTEEDCMRNDVWTFGVALYELFIGDYRAEVHPYYVKGCYGMNCSIMESGIPGIRKPRDGNLLDALIRDTLHCNPNKRLKISELRQRWQAIEQNPEILSWARANSPVTTVSPVTDLEGALSPINEESAPERASPVLSSQERLNVPIWSTPTTSYGKVEDIT